MKVSEFNASKFIDASGSYYRLAEMLINHFQYSVKDINSYDELTEEEKSIVSRDLFDWITE